MFSFLQISYGTTITGFVTLENTTLAASGSALKLNVGSATAKNELENT